MVWGNEVQVFSYKELNNGLRSANKQRPNQKSPLAQYNKEKRIIFWNNMYYKIVNMENLSRM